jgi:hypothetical protein
MLGMPIMVLTMLMGTPLYLPAGPGGRAGGPGVGAGCSRLLGQ